jgi:putative CRISPR-associated protein (TIGR02620 family)
MKKAEMIITRHPALIAYLVEIGLADQDTPVVAHASADDVRGRRVCGVMPLHLAAEAASVVVVPLDVPAEMRGQELTLEQVRRYAGRPTEYRVEALAGEVV